MDHEKSRLSVNERGRGLDINRQSLLRNPKVFCRRSLTPWLRNLSTDFTLNDCLFGSVKLTKNADPDKYKCSGYGIGSGWCSKFSLPDGTMGRTVIIFRNDMSSCAHGDNKEKYVLILREGPTHKDEMILH